MKKFFYLGALFMFIAGTANAQFFDLTEQIKQYQQIDTAEDEDEEKEDLESDSGGQSLFLSYEAVPSKVYVGEIFPIKLKAIIARENYESLTTRLANFEGFRILNLKSQWEKEQNSEYYTNTFYIQPAKSHSKLPDFIVELLVDGEIIEEAALEGGEIEITRIQGDAKFSHVVAQSLAVKDEVTNKFDDKSLIVTLEIEATYSNLKEFNLYNGSSGYYQESPMLQSLEYTIIIPNYTKSIDFTYFNTISHNFQSITVPLNIKSSDLSTHTDLNPKENKFKLYKDILFGVLGILGIAIFIFKRYKIALVASFFLFLYLFYVNYPLNKGIVEKETVIRILPTEKSSIFHVTEGDLEVEILSFRDGYVKIMLPSGRIGWVKEEHVIKN
ncbi:MAG: hypothetical protein LBS26_06700 [Campylobacteraceae bacterium]|jgi:hypothetical protein|nr:hypothetical protein [Campylobacteraceae bacterium]